jgi:hypothetical protein
MSLVPQTLKSICVDFDPSSMDEKDDAALSRPSVTANRVRSAARQRPVTVQGGSLPVGLQRFLYDQAMSTLSTGSPDEWRLVLNDLSFLILMNSSVCAALDPSLVHFLLDSLGMELPVTVQSSIFSFLASVLDLHPDSVELFHGRSFVDFVITRLPLDSACRLLSAIVSQSDEVRNGLTSEGFQVRLMHLISSRRVAAAQKASLLEVLRAFAANFVCNSPEEMEEFMFSFIDLFSFCTTEAEWPAVGSFANLFAAMHSPAIYEFLLEKPANFFAPIRSVFFLHTFKESRIPVLELLLDMAKTSETFSLQLIHLRIADFVCDIMRENALGQLVRSRALKVVKQTARWGPDCAVRYTGSELMQHLFSMIRNGCWEDRVATLRLFLVFLQFPTHEVLMNCLGLSNFFSDFTSLLASDQYSIVSKMLDAVVQVWRKALQGTCRNEFVDAMLKLIEDEEFRSLIVELSDCEDERAARSARLAVKFLTERGVDVCNEEPE